MAKNATKVQGVTIETPALTYLETTESQVRLPWNGEMVDVSTINPQGIAYLLQYGVNQTCQDATASRRQKAKATWEAMHGAEAPKDTMLKAWKELAEYIGYSTDACADMKLETFLDHVSDRAMSDRWADAHAGRMDVPGVSNRLTGMAKLMREIAEETITARAKARGMKLTTEDAKRLASNLIERNDGETAKIRAEAERRMAMVNEMAGQVESTIGGDLDSLLNG